MPTFDGGDDFVWVSGPCEGLWCLVCLGDEAVDGGLEIDDGSEDASFQTSLGQLGEVALDGVEPGARGWREVEDKTLMPCEPGTNLGMLVGRVIVEDNVNDLSGRDLGFNGVKEPDELLMPVALHAAPPASGVHPVP